MKQSSRHRNFIVHYKKDNLKATTKLILLAEPLLLFKREKVEEQILKKQKELSLRWLWRRKWVFFLVTADRPFGFTNRNSLPPSQVPDINYYIGY